MDWASDFRSIATDRPIIRAGLNPASGKHGEKKSTDFRFCVDWPGCGSTERVKVFVERKRFIHHGQERAMRFVCLGYLDEKKWEAMSQSEQFALRSEEHTSELQSP